MERNIIIKLLFTHVAPKMSVQIGKRVLAQFKSEEGSLVGVPLDLPFDVTEESLGDLCNALLKNVGPIN